jgi:hypothetical protein
MDSETQRTLQEIALPLEPIPIEIREEISPSGSHRAALSSR